MKLAALIVAGAVGLTVLVATSILDGKERSNVLIVGTETQDMPSGCSPSETAQRLINFIHAVNEGDAQQLEPLLADDPIGSIGVPEADGELGFERYDSNVEGSKLRISSRGELLEHVSQASTRSTLELVSVAVSPWNQQIPNAGGAFFTAARRQAKQSSGASILDGKAGLSCASGTIFAWVLYGVARQRSVCPAPDGWTLGQAVLACAYSRQQVR